MNEFTPLTGVGATVNPMIRPQGPQNPNYPNKKLLGYHLIIDGYTKNTELLTNKERIENFLEDVCREIGMTKIAGPFTIEYKPQNNPEKWGYSSVIIIAESHIVIHTFPEEELICIDIYSCKEFCPQHTFEYIQGKVGMYQYQANFIERGSRFQRPQILGHISMGTIRPVGAKW